VGNVPNAPYEITPQDFRPRFNVVPQAAEEVRLRLLLEEPKPRDTAFPIFRKVVPLFGDIEMLDCLSARNYREQATLEDIEGPSGIW